MNLNICQSGGGFSGGFLKLVKQKGVYPYEYMDSFKNFPENKPLDRCKFFSSVKDRKFYCFKMNSITENSSIHYILEVDLEKDYLKATNIWNVFKMNTMGDYHDLYLKADVLLLADVSEKDVSLIHV